MDTQPLAKLAASWIAVAGMDTMQQHRRETTPERTRGGSNTEVAGLTDPSACSWFREFQFGAAAGQPPDAPRAGLLGRVLRLPERDDVTRTHGTSVPPETGRVNLEEGDW
jgi:hypothetical protein